MPVIPFCYFFVICTTGTHKHFPVAAATDILKDILTSYLQEERYEVEWSQKMTKTLSEVSESQQLLCAMPFLRLQICFLVAPPLVR